MTHVLRLQSFPLHPFTHLHTEYRPLHVPPFKQRGHPLAIALNENRKLDVPKGADNPPYMEIEGKRNTDMELDEATKGTQASAAGVGTESEITRVQNK